MSRLEKTIIEVANQMIIELRYLVATPLGAESELKLAASHNITVDDVRNNEIANKMIEIKTLTSLSFLQDSGFSEESVNTLRAVDDECDGLLRTHSWVFGYGGEPG